MQVCQNEYTIGRVSRLPGDPSSHEIEKRRVGPIARMARYPAHVISHKRKRCQSVNRPGAAVPPETGVVVGVLTRLFYRRRHHWTLRLAFASQGM
jgi:hypothetical protein